MRRPLTASAMAVSISSARPSMRPRASTSPSPTRRLQARRMRRTNAAYSSFSTCRRGRFGVNLALTVSGLVSWADCAQLSSWLTACRGLARRSCWASMAAAPSGSRPRRRGASSDSCRKPPGRAGLSRVALASSPQATRPEGAPLTGLPWRATQSEADEAPAPCPAWPW